MYAVDGGTELPETTLPHLEGYAQSQPVRIGNGAYKQFQMDIYGELVDTVYLYDQAGGSIPFDFWQNIERMLDVVMQRWREPDHGIWEIRGGKRENLYSQLMCWVALDRGIKIAQHRSFPSPVDKWRKVRDEIFHEIYNGFWDSEQEAFVQAKESKVMDASALLMPLVRFVSSKEPRWLKTLARIEEQLVQDTLVYRYRLDESHSDGFSSEEGTFAICSFWYIECLARVGRVEESMLAFEKTIGFANHLGLFSEEIGETGDLLGNFPQAFTHLSLISAAYQIDKQLEKK
jgi:GH15 family glucan-1,4-alpha-glucosidase